MADKEEVRKLKEKGEFETTDDPREAAFYDHSWGPPGRVEVRPFQAKAYIKKLRPD